MMQSYAFFVEHQNNKYPNQGLADAAIIANIGYNRHSSIDIYP